MKKLCSVFLATVMLLCGCSEIPTQDADVPTEKQIEASDNSGETAASEEEKTEDNVKEGNSEVKKRDLSQITGKVCALTFDDGPSNTTSQILDVLEKYGCTASFFVVGAWAKDEGDLEIMKRAVDMGCTIENHTWEHKNLSLMTPEEITEAYTSVQDFVYESVGDYPQFLRAPGLSANAQVFETIPLTFINGSGGSADWNSKEDDAATSDLDTRVEGILKVAKDGHIFLLHDCSNNHLTPEALDIALPQLIEEGYTFVNIRELFEIKGQELTPDGKTAWTDVANKK